jgi:hypothetical protein
LKKAFDPVAFIARHGVVLASAKGPVPSIAEAVAEEPIRGSWWAHKMGKQIFNALASSDHSPDVACFRLVEGKITYVHRRLWPALVRLADEIGRDRLTVIKQEHSDSGAHRNVTTPFPKWVSPEIAASAKRMSAEDAWMQLGSWALAKKNGASAKRRLRDKRG